MEICNSLLCILTSNIFSRVCLTKNVSRDVMRVHFEEYFKGQIAVLRSRSFQGKRRKSYTRSIYIYGENLNLIGGMSCSNMTERKAVRTVKLCAALRSELPD